MPGENAALDQLVSGSSTSPSGRRAKASLPVRQRPLHYTALLIICMLLILVAIDEAQPAKWPATAALACALVTMVICLVWAIKLSRKEISDASYIKATTTSRVMIWFWLALGGTTAVTALLGIGAETFMALFEESLFGFIGVGSILLTAGPAYAEYKEAQHAATAGS